MTGPVPSLQYKPLASSEIRLLEIIRDRRFGRVRCKLSTVSLDDNPVYSALSYVWGEPTHLNNIIVNGCSIPVTRTLEKALRYVRFHWTQYFANRLRDVTNGNRLVGSLRLWIDALCINQEDPTEKGLQVQLMGQIYSSAQLVVAWLGDNERRLLKAFQAIETIAFEVDSRLLGTPIDELSTTAMTEWLKKCPEFLDLDRNGDPPRNGIICAIKTFFKLPYWERVWIVQERCLAKDILFITKSSSLAWSKVNLATLWLKQLQYVAEEADASIPLWLPTDIWSILTGRGYLPFERATDTWQFSKESELINGTMNRWVSSLHLALTYKATNAKDHIYGFLGLLELDIKPDYTSSTSIEDVYRDYTKGWLAVMKGEQIHLLKFLACAGIGHFGEKPQFATWIPDFSRLCQRTTGKDIYSYNNLSADRGLFTQGDERYPYIEGNSLFVRGMRVDSVASVFKINASMVNPMRPLLNFTVSYMAQHTTYLSGIPPLQAVFRAATEEATPALNASSILAGLAFLFTMYTQNSSNGMDISMPQVLRLFGCTRQHEYSSLDEWLFHNFFPNINLEELGFQDALSSYLDVDHPNCLKIALQMRVVESMAALKNEKGLYQLAETCGGYLCRLPSASKLGDLVCILNGSPVPVILRKVEDYYVHVGTAFVVGLMDGEAMILADEGKVTTELFELH